jgi:hypothetical protein
MRLDPVDAAFKRKVNAWCSTLVADRNSHQPPFYMGNRLALTKEQLPEAGRYLDSLKMTHELVKGGSDLGMPQTGTASWSSLMSNFKAFEEYEAAAIAGTRASDLATWTTQVSAGEKTRDAILGDLSAAGLGAGQCVIPFAREAY